MKVIQKKALLLLWSVFCLINIIARGLYNQWYHRWDLLKKCVKICSNDYVRSRWEGKNKSDQRWLRVIADCIYRSPAFWLGYLAFVLDGWSKPRADSGPNRPPASAGQLSGGRAAFSDPFCTPCIALDLTV